MVSTKGGLSMETQWARPRADANRGLRRGAWYRVIALTPRAVIIDVNHETRTVPREGVEIVDTPPQHSDDHLGVSTHDSVGMFGIAGVHANSPVDSLHDH